MAVDESGAEKFENLTELKKSDICGVRNLEFRKLEKYKGRLGVEDY